MSSRTFKKLILLSLTFSSLSFASDNALNYPELQVVPKASERVKMLKIKEKKQSVTTPLALQISATATLTAGLLQFSNVDKNDDENSRSPWAGVIVGGSWLGINYYVHHKYDIFGQTLRDMKLIKGNTLEAKLSRERIAEEGLRRAARLSKKMRWLSAITNAGASAFMLSKSEKDSFSEVYNALSIAAALGPIFFKGEWESAWKDQRSYKKKVYGPIITTSVFKSGSKYAPGLLFSSTF